MYYGEGVRRFRARRSSCERPWHNQVLQLMTDTTTLGIRMSDTTTRGIRVQVRSEFIPDRSSPRDGSYLFQYHVRISNVGAEVTQLISREWIITSADGEVERVKGQGVVGEQPVLPPGGWVDAGQLSDGHDRRRALRRGHRAVYTRRPKRVELGRLKAASPYVGAGFSRPYFLSKLAIASASLS
jgi:hypothetical protein